MSTKLNAEKLADKRYPLPFDEPSWDDMQKQGAYAAAIREVAQPIADERDAIIACIPEGYVVNSGGDAIGAIKFLVASYRVTIDEHNQWRDAARDLEIERDELHRAL